MEDAMKDDVVSFKTAKLAQEKGLDFKLGLGYKTHGDYYNYKGELNGDVTDEIRLMVRKIKDEFRSTPAPTLSLLQKRLRDKFNLNVAIKFKPNIKKWDFIVYNLGLNGKEYIKFYSKYFEENPGRRFETYEEALDFGLYEALKDLPTIV